MKPKVAVSACLVGQNVRFNGGHCQDRFLIDSLHKYVELVPLCPEVAIGLGVPRPTLRLVEDGEDNERLVPSKGDGDHTEALDQYARTTQADLRSQGILGIILKSKSPSCGMERVKVYTTKGMPVRSSAGRFAKIVRTDWPEIICEEEGRLNDSLLRHSFLTRIFGSHRLKSLFDSKWTPGEMVAFHSREKLLLLAHEPKTYRSLGKLVARIKEIPREDFEEQYRREFLGALSVRPKRNHHLNVLQHAAGYFRKRAEDKRYKDLTETIQAFAEGERTFLESRSLLKHYIHCFDETYLENQTYLEPYPEPLLRSSNVLTSL